MGAWDSAYELKHRNIETTMLLFNLKPEQFDKGRLIVVHFTVV